MAQETAPLQNLVFTRIFNAPVALVWQAWTDPELIKEWWGPDMFTCPSAVINLQVGQTSLVCMRAPQQFGGQDMYSTWTYTNIIPLQRIEFIHNLADEHGNTISPAALGMPQEFPINLPYEITFKDLGNNTTALTVTQYGWPAIPMVKMAQMGMEQCLNKIALALQKRV